MVTLEEEQLLDLIKNHIDKSSYSLDYEENNFCLRPKNAFPANDDLRKLINSQLGVGGPIHRNYCFISLKDGDLKQLVRRIIFGDDTRYNIHPNLKDMINSNF